MSCNMQHYFLCIDNGTQSVRAMIIDATGAVIAKSQHVLPPYNSPKQGWSEQQPQVFYHAVTQACKKLWQQPQAPSPQQVSAVAVTTQRATMCFLDENAQATYPAITWMDKRRCSKLNKMPLWWRLAIFLSAKSKQLQFAREKAPSNWLFANRQKNWQQTKYYCQLSAYLNFRLCGKYQDSIASQVGFIPFSYRQQQYSNKFSWQWFAYKVKPHSLPKLLPAATLMGKLSANAAQDLGGINREAVLIAAGADKACDVLGMGISAQDKHMAAISLGTRATILQSTRQYSESANSMPAYPSLIFKEYLIEEALARGFYLVTWFISTFSSDKSSKLDYASLEKFLNKTPMGANGLLLQPTWGSDVEDDKGVRGAVLGLDGNQSEADLYRAIIEGIAYGLKDGKNKIQRQSKQKIKKLRVAGGGAKSDAVLQVIADVIGLPIERLHTVETASLGAAMCCAVGLGLYQDFNQSIQKMVTVERIFEPDKAAHKFYKSVYENVYIKMHKPLLNLHLLLEMQKLN